MIKKQDNDSNVIKNHSSRYWFLFFSSLAALIFFFRGFLFNEYGGFRVGYLEDIVSLSIFILLLLSIVISLLVFHEINLERNVKHVLENGISKKRDLDNLMSACMGSNEFKFLLYLNLFVLFICSFLSDLLRRSTDEAMVGVYIMFYLLALSIPVAVLTFIGMLIVTKGIKKSLFAKSSFLLSIMAISVFTFYAFFRILWIDLYF